jgi:4-hydroxybenzoate polyprenyltransferase
MIGILFATPEEAAPFLRRLGIPPESVREGETIAFTAHGMNGRIAISGMGRAAAAAACVRLIKEDGVTRFVNAGVCGAVRDGIAVGDCFAIEAVVDGTAFQHDGSLIRHRLLAGEASRRLAAVPPFATMEGPRPRGPHDANRKYLDGVDGVRPEVSEANPSPAICPAFRLLPWPGLAEARLVTVDDGLFEAARRARLAAAADLVDMEGYGVAEICAKHGVPCHLVKGVTDLAIEGERATLQANLAEVSERLAGILFDGLAAFAPAPSGAAAKINRLTRVEHTLFSLPLLFAGAWIGARGAPRLMDLLWIVVAGIGARTFGMTLNRILDRDLDARNPRTWGRELPTGAVSLTQAIALAVFGLLTYLVAAAALGPLCLALAPVPILPLAVYSLLKRWTSLCHLGIGLCLALAPLGAYVATAKALPFSPEIIALGLFTFLWISGFDIIYALQDIASDRRIGVKSLPAALGASRATAIAALLHVGAIGALAALWLARGSRPAATAAFIVSLAAFAAAYSPRLPLPTRFFPLSAIAATAAALVVLLGQP